MRQRPRAPPLRRGELLCIAGPGPITELQRERRLSTSAWQAALVLLGIVLLALVGPLEGCPRVIPRPSRPAWLHAAAGGSGPAADEPRERRGDASVTTAEFGTVAKHEALARIITRTAWHAGQLALTLKYGGPAAE